MSHDLGYEGICTRCGQTQRIYYFYADRCHKDKMMDGSIMFERSNCPACVTSKIIQTPHTMKWQRKLQPLEVEKDLLKHNNGISIDFTEADRQMKTNENNDKWLANNEQRVADYRDWVKRTEGGIQKKGR